MLSREVNRLLDLVRGRVGMARVIYIDYECALAREAPNDQWPHSSPSERHRTGNPCQWRAPDDVVKAAHWGSKCQGRIIFRRKLGTVSAIGEPRIWHRRLVANGQRVRARALARRVSPRAALEGRLHLLWVR